MRPWKAALAAMACLAAVAGSLYAPGYLTFRLIRLTDQPVSWDTWWHYARVLDQPAYAPYALRIRAAGVIGISLPAIACVGVLVLLCRSKSDSLYGEARF